MDFGCWTSLIRFLLLCRAAKCAFVPDGVYRAECRDRYFMIAVDLSFTGQEPVFEAMDRTGVFPITEQYAAQCGYTVSILPAPGIVELRASYFSCHTTNQNDHIFTFNFKLIATHDGERVHYALNKTCSPSLPWSSREVTCEVNYLEVSVKSDVLCPLGPKPDSWDSFVQMVYGAATPGWHVVLVKDGKEMTPLNFSDASLNGHSFAVTENRLVFRAAYGQPQSSRTVINGISVEVAHAILFSRQEWHVFLVDLVASCTMYEAPDNDGGYVTWGTPLAQHPGLHTTNFSFGLNGKLWEPNEVRAVGCRVTNENGAVKIGIPYDADGAYRKSVVTADLFDLYTHHFYMEQIASSDGGAESRTRTFRKLSSPPIKRFLLTENRTVPHEEMFTVFVGNVPEDLELVSIHLNEEEFKAPFVNSSSYTLDISVFPNHSYGYTLKVPFDNPFIIKRFSAENAATENELNIACTVVTRPESELYSYHITVTALTAVSPPQFVASCSESGITFTLDHGPSGFLWDIAVDSSPLTTELAAQQGYILSNNSQTLQLEVPLFTYGYKYEDITLKGFLGTFETYVRNRKTSEVQSSSVKTCPFTAKEIVVCSKDGRMTVVADLSEAVASGGSPDQTSLLDEYCGPIDTDDTRALYSFPLNTCDTKMHLGNLSVTYTNEIRYSLNSSAQIGSILVQCTYSLAALHPLFKLFRFGSETAGVGHIVHPLPFGFSRDLQISSTVSTAMSTLKPATISTTKPTMPTTLLTMKPTSRPTVDVQSLPSVLTTKPTTDVTTATEPTGKPPVYRHTVKYIRVMSYFKDLQNRHWK